MYSSHAFLPFRSAAVLGAGVMGAQIAAHLANAGLSVLLLDIPAKEGPKNTIVDAALKNITRLKPNPFVSKAAAARIVTGNFDDHLHLLSGVEWVIEAVIENMDIKRSLLARVAEAAAPHTIITTNTSGLPIHQIADGQSESFRQRFFGTHFFNPPRYMKLLEIIPTADSDDAIVERIKWFGRVHLGKSIVVAKDTPNFIANRVGTYAMMQALRGLETGYTVEEIDLLTGTLIGHPRSATFRTCDVVGLDTLLYVAKNLHAAIPHDESRDGHLPPALLEKLVAAGATGQKVRKGFYQKVGKEIRSVNPQTMAYEAPAEMDLGDMHAYKKIPDLAERIRAVYRDEGRAGRFIRQNLLDIIAYSARRIPEIADAPAALDRAICWGFNWEVGPFQLWDILSFETVIEDAATAGIALPAWVDEMKSAGAAGFYKETSGSFSAYVPGSGYQPETVFPDQISLVNVKRETQRTLLTRKEAALLDIGEGVALYEFRSKANTLGNDVVEGVFQAIDYVEQHDFHGLVIGNEGKNFSVGANLGEVAYVIEQGQFAMLEGAVKRFQEMINRIRYARKPVVMAMHGMAVGGACEMAMAAAGVVAATESYIGLPELGAGLIPAGCGTTYFAARAATQAADPFPSAIQHFSMKYFQTMATATVATSAHEAMALGFLAPEKTVVVMHADRRIHAARTEVIRLAALGYAPPPVRNAIMVLGQPGKAAMTAAAYQFRQGGFASEYDQHLAERLAHILNGGDISAPTAVHEEYLYDLEREVFLQLLGQRKTQERIHSILTTNKPLRN